MSLCFSWNKHSLWMWGGGGTWLLETRVKGVISWLAFLLSDWFIRDRHTFTPQPVQHYCVCKKQYRWHLLFSSWHFPSNGMAMACLEGWQTSKTCLVSNIHPICRVGMEKVLYPNVSSCECQQARAKESDKLWMKFNLACNWAGEGGKEKNWIFFLPAFARFPQLAMYMRRLLYMWLVECLLQ